jgi:hypothetical protein
MFSGSGVPFVASAGVVAVVDRHHPGVKKGPDMPFLLVAIIVVAGVGLFRFMRTRTAN